MLGDEDALGWSGLSTIVFLDNDKIGRASCRERV